MAEKNQRPKAALNLTKLTALGKFIEKVRGIVASFVANAATLGTPAPTTTVVSGHIDDLQTANDAVALGTTGAVTTRDLKYNIVLKDIYKWQNFVQDLADSETDIIAAKNMITLSGFDIRVGRVFDKPDLTAKATPMAGQVKLIAKAAARRACYEWQISTNGGTTWTSQPITLTASTYINALVSKQSYVFRFRATTKDGTGSWSVVAGIVMQ